MGTANDVGFGLSAGPVLISAEIVALVIGSLFYRRWLSREAIDNDFVKRGIENAIGQSIHSKVTKVTKRRNRSQDE